MVYDIYNAVQERYVVRYEHKSVLIVVEISFKPLYVLNVEIVSRLIEQQHVRLFKKELSEQDLSSLAAGKIGNVAIKPEVKQTERSCNFFYFRIYHVEVVDCEHILYDSQLFHILFHLLLVSFCHFVADHVHSLFHFKKERER